jgi:hypothetical protein
MNISEVYQKYQIMPQLAEHQLRVAAVGEIICENLLRGKTRNLTRKDAEPTFGIDKENIITALLLHDMGNIIKFDLTKTGALLNKDIDVGVWEKVKDEYIERYGNDEHHATIAIAKELQVSQRIMELIDAISFDTAMDNAQAQDFGKKICEYCDDRVSPHGVVSLEERLADLRLRYGYRTVDAASIKKRDNFEAALRIIEQQIFEHATISPGDITEQAVRERVERLKTWPM